MLVETRLGDVDEGELVLWKRKLWGDTLAEVLDQSKPDRTVVLADNNIEYAWDKEMRVFVDP